MADPLVDLIAQALARDPDETRRLVQLLHPVVAARVARVLRRVGRAANHNAEDLVQEVFAFLFEGGGKALRAWQPERGLSLQNFVGLLAERQVISIARSGRRCPWTSDPTLPEGWEEQAADADTLEPALLSRDLLVVLLDRLRVALSPLGMQLFERLYVEEQTVEEIAVALQMSADAVYAWRSRLKKVIAKLASELDASKRAEVA